MTHHPYIKSVTSTEHRTTQITAEPESVSPQVAEAAASTRTEAEVRAARVPTLCVDCQFHQKAAHGNGWQYDKCTNPKRVKGYNPVNGEPRGLVYCEGMRESRENCGPDAKWFEPKDAAQ